MVLPKYLLIFIFRAVFGSFLFFCQLVKVEYPTAHKSKSSCFTFWYSPVGTCISAFSNSDLGFISSCF